MHVLSLHLNGLLLLDSRYVGCIFVIDGQFFIYCAAVIAPQACKSTVYILLFTVIYLQHAHFFFHCTLMASIYLIAAFRMYFHHRWPILSIVEQLLLPKPAKANCISCFSSSSSSTSNMHTSYSTANIFGSLIHRLFAI